MFDTLQTFIAPRLRSFLKLLSIGHFHKKRIVFFSYFGAQYSCNPKYISEYMQERHPDFEIIWAFKTFLTYMIRELKPSNICILTFCMYA